MIQIYYPQISIPQTVSKEKALVSRNWISVGVEECSSGCFPENSYPHFVLLILHGGQQFHRLIRARWTKMKKSIKYSWSFVMWLHLDRSSILFFLHIRNSLKEQSSDLSNKQLCSLQHLPSDGHSRNMGTCQWGVIFCTSLFLFSLPPFA